MTFVYRSQKGMEIKILNDLGPGSYNITSNNQINIGSICLKNKKVNQSSMFSSTTSRDAFNTDRLQKQIQQNKKIQKIKKIQQKQSHSPTQSAGMEQPKTKIQQNQDQLQNNLNLLKSKKLLDCRFIFDSKVQRFQLPVNNSQQIYPQTKLKQKLLQQQFRKLLVRQSMDNIQDVKLKQLNLHQLNQKKRNLFELKQSFPSIPNWQNSYGYRLDTVTKKMVPNENPNKIIQLEENKEEREIKNNHALGPGYYVFVDKEAHKLQKEGNRLSQQAKQKELLNFISYPQMTHEPVIYDSIEGRQNKIKLRVRLLGKSHLNKMQDYEVKYLNSNHIDPNQKADLLKFHKQKINSNQNMDKKSILLQYQMLKKFGKYIPKNDQPGQYLERLQEMKRSQVLLKSSLHSNGNNTHNIKSDGNFLSKSSRFDLESQNKQNAKSRNSVGIVNNNDQCETADQSYNSSNLFLGTFNKKQPYSMGQERFKKTKVLLPLGPGSYDLPGLKSSSPCLKMKQERFNSINKAKNNEPGPGEYNISKQMLENSRNLREQYREYKNQNKDQIKDNSKKEDSMQALYQTWGRQMSTRIKQDRLSEHSSILLNHNNNINTQKDNSKDNKQNILQHKSIQQTKRQIIQEMKRIVPKTKGEKNTISLPNKTKNNQNRDIIKDKENCVHPKILKHLYEYKQQKPGPPPLGPGSYQITKDLDRKTFNVTYS